MSTNTRISFLSKIIDEDIFEDKRNQTPSAEKINKMEWKKKDNWILVVWCSATESVKGSTVVKNGLSALRYLKLGNGKEPNSSFIVTKKDPIRRIEINKINPFLILCSSLLIFWINIHSTKNIVGIINENPPNPNTKPNPGRSNIIAVKSNVPTNSGILQIKNLWSFLIKGNTKINNPSGIIKNWIPPQDASEKVIIIPPKIIFENAIFLFLDLIPLKNKYNANKA